MNKHQCVPYCVNLNYLAFKFYYSCNFNLFVSLYYHYGYYYYWREYSFALAGVQCMLFYTIPLSFRYAMRAGHSVKYRYHVA